MAQHYTRLFILKMLNLSGILMYIFFLYWILRKCLSWKKEKKKSKFSFFNSKQYFSFLCGTNLMQSNILKLLEHIFVFSYCIWIAFNSFVTGAFQSEQRRKFPILTMKIASCANLIIKELVSQRFYWIFVLIQTIAISLKMHANIA